MFPPIRPKPIIPISIDSPLIWPLHKAATSALSNVGLFKLSLF